MKKIAEIIRILSGETDSKVGESFTAEATIEQYWRHNRSVKVRLSYTVESHVIVSDNGPTISKRVPKIKIYIPEIKLAVSEIDEISRVELHEIKAFGNTYTSEYSSLDEIEDIVPIFDMLLGDSDGFTDWKGPLSSPSRLHSKLKWTTLIERA